jgi:hypothetical protein
MEVQMLLCDFAEVLNGKLYIMGGGWSWIGVNQPVSIAVALKIMIPWNDANTPHQLKFVLVNADGHPVIQSTPEGDKPVEVIGPFGVGRPYGVRQRSDLDLPVTFKLGPLVLDPQVYEAVVEIDGIIVKRLSFEAVLAPPGIQQ